MVDDEIHGYQRVDFLGIAAKGNGGIAHCGQINNSGNAGKVLKHELEADITAELAAG